MRPRDGRCLDRELRLRAPPDAQVPVVRTEDVHHVAMGPVVEPQRDAALDGSLRDRRPPRVEVDAHGRLGVHHDAAKEITPAPARASCGAALRRISRRGVRSRNGGQVALEFVGKCSGDVLAPSHGMNLRPILPLIGSAFLVLGTAGCPKSDKPAEGPAERAGKSVDNAAEKTKEGAKEAGQKTEDTAHDVKRDVKKNTQ